MAFSQSLNSHNHGSKLSCEEVNTLCNLLERFDACQERIRIHRNRPLPDTLARYPKAKTRKEQRHALKRAAALAAKGGLAAPRPAQPKLLAVSASQAPCTSLQPKTTDDDRTPCAEPDFFSEEEEPAAGD